MIEDRQTLKPLEKIYRGLGQRGLIHPQPLTDPQLRHPDDSVEGQLWERKQGHADTPKAECPNTQAPRG